MMFDVTKSAVKSKQILMTVGSLSSNLLQVEHTC